MINRLKFAVVIMFIALIACEKDNNDDSSNSCKVSNPVEELAWLKEAIEDVENDEYSYFVMAKYQGETVFYYGNCNPVVNYISFVLNCSGEPIANKNDIFYELSESEVVWRHHESQCNFQ